MENKVESPDYQMDISEACTTAADNISTSSASPTISNQADCENFSEKRSGIDSTVETMTKNMNLIQLATSHSRSDKENLENRNNLTLDTNQHSQSSTQKLTPVHHHPLMFEEEVEDSCNNQNLSNFPDVVTAHHHHQPLRLVEPLTKDDNSVNNNSAKFRKPIYREPSPDLDDFLSGSEPDVSQYQAEVCSSFQTVALVSSNPQQQVVRLQQSSSSPKFLNLEHQRRKIPLSDELKIDDDSSPEELSFRADDFIDDDDEPLQINLPSDNRAVNASEESRNVRSFQLITLPDGKMREIDMKVIEPYKRILSHGGYLKAGGHNAIVVFSACHLPDRSRKDYNYVMNNLFYYVVKTLEQLVTEDYVLVYLHGASNRKNSPPFPWLKKCYQMLDRRLRKSLKSCYIVHPTFWLKSLIWMTRPFISAKFWRKMVYVPTLEELYTLVPLERNSIPDKVLSFNARHSSSMQAS